MATEYSDGDVLYGVDLDNQVEAAGKNGVLSGWTVQENATPNMSVDVLQGDGVAGGVYNSTGSTTNVVITASHASLDRLDIIVVNSSGTISAVTGTAAATPNPPDLPDDNILLAIIDVAATVTAIYNADITSRRLLIGPILDEMIGDLEITNGKLAGSIAWSKITVDGNVVYKNQTETITGFWTFSTQNIKMNQVGIDFHDVSGLTGRIIGYNGEMRIWGTPGDIFLQCLTNDYQWVNVEASSTGGGGIQPTLAEKGSSGSPANPWDFVRACTLGDVCSEYVVPKRALETLESIMLKDVGAKIRDEPQGHVLKSEKLPAFLRGKKPLKDNREFTGKRKKDQKIHVMRNVSATVSFLQGCIYELLQENKGMKQRLEVLEAS